MNLVRAMQQRGLLQCTKMGRGRLAMFVVPRFLPCRLLWCRSTADHAGGRHISMRGFSGSVHCCAAQPKAVLDLVKRVSRDDVNISFARSGGAGGQNVNKVNTKVDMRLKLEAAAWLSDDMKAAVSKKEKNRINKDGELVVTSTLTRSQADNVDDALDKLQDILDKAAQSLIPQEVDPVKLKKLAKQKKVANENRLQTKKKASMKKADRRAKNDY